VVGTAGGDRHERREMTIVLGSDEVQITDEELTLEALAADPDAPLDADAVPFDPNAGEVTLLPAWYMPVSHRVRRSRRTRLMVALFVLAILAVNGVGLCVTYGHLELPI
jgi:hypothetical protein